MKFFLLLFIIMLGRECAAQQKDSDSLYIEQLDWHVKLPPFLYPLNKESWNNFKDQSVKLIGDANGVNIKNKSRTFFAFGAADRSAFEAVTEPISKEKAANYDAGCEAMYKIFYNTILYYKPNQKIDTVKSIEYIDSLAFHVFKTTVHESNGSTTTTINYSRVFGDQELTINIMYTQNSSGYFIQDALNNSKFGKRE